MEVTDLAPLRVTMPRVLLVTDPAYADEAIVAVVDAALAVFPRGAFGVQLRDKERSDAAFVALGKTLRRRTREAGASFFVNGRAHVARDLGADGVHLGGDAMTVRDARAVVGTAAVVSVAAHTDDDLARALEEGADAALVSPIFATPGKGPARGTNAIVAARRIVGARLVLYALGGVTGDNASRCFQAGADGVALVRGLLASDDPARDAKAILVAMPPEDYGEPRAW